MDGGSGGTAQQNIAPDIPGLKNDENVSGGAKGGAVGDKAREEALKQAGKAAGAAVGGTVGAKIGEEVGKYANKVVGKKGSEDRSVVSKIAPTGIIFSTLIAGIFGIGGLTTVAQPFHILANIQEKFDTQSLGLEKRSNVVMRHMMSPKSTNGTVGGFINKKYKTMSSRTIKRLDQKGIKVIDADTGEICSSKCKPTALEMDGKKISAGEFKAEMETNKAFNNNFTAAKRTRFQAFKDKFAAKFNNKFNIALNKFKNWLGDVAGSDGNSKAALGKSVDSATKFGADTSDTTAAKPKNDDGSFGPSQETGKTDTHIDVDGDTNTRLQSLSDSFSKAGKVANLLTGLPCTVITVAATVSVGITGLKVAQMVGLFGQFSESIDKTKAGDGNNSPINTFMSEVNTPSVRKVGEVSVNDATAEITNAELVSSGESAKSAAESDLMRFVTTDSAMNPNDPSVLDYSYEGVFNNFFGNNSLLSGVEDFVQSASNLKSIIRGCALARAAAGAINVVSNILSFGMWTVVQESGSSLLNMTMQVAISKGMPKLLQFAVKGFLTDALGEDLGNALISGAASSYSSMHQGGGGVAANLSTVQAYHLENQRLIAQYAEIERDEKNPFDVTSKYTFLGSIVGRFIPHISTMSSLSGIFTTIGSVFGQSMSVLLPTSSALSVSAITASIGNCPALEGLGVVGTPTCQPWLTSPISEDIIETDPDDLYQKLLNDDNGAGGIEIVNDEPKVREGSTLDKFGKYCMDRNAQLGVSDPGIIGQLTGSDSFWSDLPLISDVADIFTGLNTNDDDIDWASGQNCVDSSNNQYTYGMLPYYQLYYEDQRILENLTEETDAVGGSGGPGLGGGSNNQDADAVQRAFADYMTSHGNQYTLASTGGTYQVGTNGCTTMSAWYVGEYTALTYGGGNGGDVATNLANRNGLVASSEPRAPAIFETRNGSFSSANCGTGLCGHTGVVLSVDDDGAIMILDTWSGMTNDPMRSRLRTIQKNQYSGSFKFTYVGDHLK
jgi:hypothetical protein